MIGPDLSESPPGSPSSPCPYVLEDEPEDAPTNGLQLDGTQFGLEHIYDYESGGHHPVHLNDVLGDGRYRVLHKLGNGGYANVWLCRDLVAPAPKYVALKVLMAEASTEDCRELLCAEELKGVAHDDAVCVALDHFRSDGPNGSHLCFVYPVLGPKVSSGLLQPSEDPDRMLRAVCHQTVRAMAALHKLGICHGDFTPSNVLQPLSGLDGLPEEQVLAILGEPKTASLLEATNQPHQLPTAPQYLVYPVSWRSVNTHYLSSKPSVNDFGEAFRVTDPPEDLGIPSPYRSPELFLETDRPDVAGFGTDLWALGCTLFEIRTGRKLFNLFCEDDDDEYLDAMVQILGVMPEPWWSTTWASRTKLYKDEPDELGRAVLVQGEAPDEGARGSFHPSVAYGARSIKEKLAPGMWYMSEDGPEEIHREMEDKEVDLFADLLGRLLRWTPAERVSAEELLSHAWFQM